LKKNLKYGLKIALSNKVVVIYHRGNQGHA